MVGKYFGGTLPADRAADPIDDELLTMAKELRGKYEGQMEKYAFQNALIEVFRVISRANKYIDETAPWVLAKDEANKPRLATVLYNLLECLRISTSLLNPFMPDTAEKARVQIGASAEDFTWEKAGQFGILPAEVSVQKGEALFPRIDMEKELAALAEAQAAPKKEEIPAQPQKEPITIDDFDRVDMTVCKILACENVPKSEKLLKFQLDDGSGETRQILSGIAKYYQPEQLVGKTVVACTNLPPRKMMGQMSNGMLLSAEKDGVLNLVMLDDKVPAGAKLC